MLQHENILKSSAFKQKTLDNKGENILVADARRNDTSTQHARCL